MFIACVSFPDPTAPEVLWCLLNAIPFALTGGMPSLTAAAWFACPGELAALGSFARPASQAQAGLAWGGGPAANVAGLYFVAALLATAGVTAASLLYGLLPMRGRFRP